MWGLDDDTNTRMKAGSQCTWSAVFWHKTLRNSLLKTSFSPRVGSRGATYGNCTRELANLLRVGKDTHKSINRAARYGVAPVQVC